MTVSNNIEFLKSLRDDAMGLEPGDRAQVAEVIDEIEQKTMALRRLHSLPINPDTDTLEGYAGAVRSICWDALESETTKNCGCTGSKTNCAKRAPADWACGCECHQSEQESDN